MQGKALQRKKSPYSDMITTPPLNGLLNALVVKSVSDIFVFVVLFGLQKNTMANYHLRRPG